MVEMFLIFSSGTATSAGDSYQLSFYGRYYNNGQGYATNKGGYIKASVYNSSLYGGQPSGQRYFNLGNKILIIIVQFFQ